MKQNNNETAIKVNQVSKDFYLPHEKVDSFKSVFTQPFKKRSTIETQHALKNINFEVKKGEFFGIVGRNGSGKSTLLKIIANIYQPSKGSVKVDGRLVPFIELGVGFNPELTGRENVYLNGALMGFSRGEIDAKYERIVDFAEIKRFMDQKLKNYSSGMQVRLAFSVATILAESDILLIDEVLAVGDADFQKKCFDYFKGLKKQKKTVVFVSHDMNAVREYCDRAILIEQNEIVAEGSASSVAKQYTKLFMPDQYEAEEANRKKKKNDGKWGYGGADIKNVSVASPLVTEKEAIVKFNVELEVLRDFEEGLVYGFVIKDLAGDVILGTNSKITGTYKKEYVKKGETKVIEWSLPNIFSEGTFTFEPAVNDASNMELSQWWDDAGRFEVVKPTSSPYKVTPDIKLKLKK